MTIYSIKLVNHTKASERLQGAIRTHLQNFFDEIFASVSDDAKVTWGTGHSTDAIVLHLVEDVAHSYLQQKMAGQDIRGDAGGHTRTRQHITGSEFYLFSVSGTRRSMLHDSAYARLALHEAFHNQWPGWSNDEMHGQGGIAASPPKELTDANKAFMRKGLSMKNEQLL